MLVPWLAPEISFLLNLICFLIFQGRYLSWSFVFWAFFGQVLLASSRWRLGKLLNILHRTVPTTKNYPVQNVSSATVENPCSKITNFRLTTLPKQQHTRHRLLMKSENLSSSPGRHWPPGINRRACLSFPCSMLSSAREGVFLSLLSAEAVLQYENRKT